MKTVDGTTKKPERIVYTPAEVAELLGVNKATVYRRIKAGEIPAVTMGRIYVPKKPFDAMFD